MDRVVRRYPETLTLPPSDRRRGTAARAPAPDREQDLQSRARGRRCQALDQLAAHPLSTAVTSHPQGGHGGGRDLRIDTGAADRRVGDIDQGITGRPIRLTKPHAAPAELGLGLHRPLLLRERPRHRTGRAALRKSLQITQGGRSETSRGGRGGHSRRARSAPWSRVRLRGRDIPRTKPTATAPLTNAMRPTLRATTTPGRTSMTHIVVLVAQQRAVRQIPVRVQHSDLGGCRAWGRVVACIETRSHGCRAPSSPNKRR